MTGNSRLFACPDCGHGCSWQAESCPGCGRYIQNLSRTIEVTPGVGWIGKVAWGIVLSSFLWGMILTACFVLGVVLLFILFGVGAAMSPPKF